MTEVVKYIGLDVRTRFDIPQQLMAYVGLVPSEHSSGARTQRGRITRAGNAQACTTLIEPGRHHVGPFAPAKFPTHLGQLDVAD